MEFLCSDFSFNVLASLNKMAACGDGEKRRGRWDGMKYVFCMLNTFVFYVLCMWQRAGTKLFKMFIKCTANTVL